jgi:hypothetical protein
MESLVARLPATDQKRGSLRYYAEFSVRAAGYTLRYPAARTFELLATSNFTSVELPAQNAVARGEKVYNFFWGYGPDKVRSTTYEGYPIRVGPPAMDVANDGRIALLDPVNDRVIIYSPNEESYSSIPLPFSYKYYGREDIQFDRDGRLVILDLFGEAIEGTPYSIPHGYRLLLDGSVEDETAVFVKSPTKFTKDLKVLDQYDYRMVAPFNSLGVVNSREAQRQKQAWEYPYRYVAGLDPYVARFADVKKGAAFEVHSVSPLGSIMGFEERPGGYIMTFFIGDQIRAVWLDPSGIVMKDVTLPNGLYSEVNFDGQVTITQDGSLYIMSSTPRGIEIHFVGMP